MQKEESKIKDSGTVLAGLERTEVMQREIAKMKDDELLWRFTDYTLALEDAELSKDDREFCQKSVELMSARVEAIEHQKSVAEMELLIRRGELR